MCLNVAFNNSLTFNDRKKSLKSNVMGKKFQKVLFNFLIYCVSLVFEYYEICKDDLDFSDSAKNTYYIPLDEILSSSLES